MKLNFQRLSNLILIRRHLMYEIADPDTVRRQTVQSMPRGCEFSFPLTAEALDHLHFEHGSDERRALESYVSHDDRAAAISLNNIVVCRGLVRFGGFIKLDGNRRFRQVAKGEAHVHYCRTTEAYRGLRLYPALLQRILVALGQDSQVTQVTIACEKNNIASRKGIERAGFLPSQEITTIGFLGGRIARSWSFPISAERELNDGDSSSSPHVSLRKGNE